MANLGGLPTAQLPAAGEIGGPAFQMTDPQGNVISQAGTMVADPLTGMAEPVYPDAVTGNNQDVTRIDPVSLATWQGEQEMSQLSIFDQQIAKVKEPIQRELDTSYKQYQIDVVSIRNSGADQEQQRQRIQQINNQYSKQWVRIKSKLEPQVEALTQQKASTQHQIRLNQALRMKEIQTYAGLAEQGIINEDAARSLQYKVLGFDVPVTAFRPPKYQSPYEVVQRNRQLMSSVQGLIAQYKMEPAKDRPFKRWDVPAQLMVLKPQTEWTGTDRYGRPAPDEKRDYVPATPDQIQQYQWALDAQDRLREESRAAAEQLIGKRVTDLAGAASPMANGVRNAMPKQRRAGRQVTAEQARALLQEAGGDKQRARELARARGLTF